MTLKGSTIFEGNSEILKDDDFELYLHYFPSNLTLFVTFFVTLFMKVIATNTHPKSSETPLYKGFEVGWVLAEDLTRHSTEDSTKHSTIAVFSMFWTFDFCH